MFVEIQTGVNFLATYLYGRIPRRRIYQFSEQLACFLVRELACPPISGEQSGYRVVDIDPEGKTDESVVAAAKNVVLDMSDFLACFKKSVSLWISVGEVLMVEEGSSAVIYKAGHAEENAKSISWIRRISGNPGYAIRFSSVLSTSTGYQRSQQSRDPKGPKPLSWIVTVENPGTKFTIGEFAMTRFGSTKIKKKPPPHLEIPHKSCAHLIPPIFKTVDPADADPYGYNWSELESYIPLPLPVSTSSFTKDTSCIHDLSPQTGKTKKVK